MYRCKECKAEYKNKVEYCDCGNNTFDYIEDSPVASKQKHIKNMTLDEKSELISKLFFTLCIIISIIVWLIPIKPTTTKKSPNQTKPKPAVTKQIPDIEKIWKDNAVNNLPAGKTNITEPIYTASGYNPTQNITLNNNVNKSKTVKKNSSHTTVSKPAEYEIVYNPPPTPKKKEVTQQRNLAKPSRPTYNPNSSAMLKYKGDLRAALFSKFAAGSIPGSGTCEISFSVDSTGKLINRKFTHESDNKTLNDVVYYMLMSVPKYLPPPSEYSGQTIKMKFVIDNGSYEITIN